MHLLNIAESRICIEKNIPVKQLATSKVENQGEKRKVSAVLVDI